MILQGPGIGLHRALRIGLAAELQMDATQALVADQGRHLDGPLRVQVLGREPQFVEHLGHVVIVRQMRLGERHDHPLAPVFGGIAQQLIHQRPHPLFLGEQRGMVVRSAAAIAARGLPAHHALVQHQHVGPGPRQLPARAEPRDPAPHDDDRRARPGHESSPSSPFEARDRSPSPLVGEGGGPEDRRMRGRAPTSTASGQRPA